MDELIVLNCLYQETLYLLAYIIDISYVPVNIVLYILVYIRLAYNVILYYLIKTIC